MRSYQELRKTYENFVYLGYEARQEEEGLLLVYHFEIPGLASFSPSWVFPVRKDYVYDGKDERLEEAFFTLGMVELVSYWKTACPPRVIVHGHVLTEKMIAFWKKLYFNGLGEFYYTNGIEDDEAHFMTIIPLSGVVSDEEYRRRFPVTAPQKALSGNLVPVGGGKDSAVTLSILSKEKEDTWLYVINPRQATKDTGRVAGFPETKVISPKRTLDKNMLSLNKAGFLNGHTPFSAIVAASSTIVAYLYGLKYIVLSNESSANESTVPGSYVNHQYSKSLEFEQDFCAYEKAYLRTGTQYFSLLRPWSELQIAARFAKEPQFHPVFRSCNVGSKEDKWCGHCSKCLFVALILSPFVGTEELTTIFGRDMLSDESLVPVFSQLIGLVPDKPFECVGSRDEVNTAICMSIKKREEQQETLPYLLAYYKNQTLYEQYKELSLNGGIYQQYFAKENLLPDQFLSLMQQETRELTLT